MRNNNANIPHLEKPPCRLTLYVGILVIWAINRIGNASMALVPAICNQLQMAIGDGRSSRELVKRRISRAGEQECWYSRWPNTPYAPIQGFLKPDAGRVVIFALKHGEITMELCLCGTGRTRVPQSPQHNHISCLCFLPAISCTANRPNLFSLSY